MSKKFFYDELEQWYPYTNLIKDNLVYLWKYLGLIERDVHVLP